MSNEDARAFAEQFLYDWAKAGDDLNRFMDHFAEQTQVQLMVQDVGALAEVRGPFNKKQWREQTRKESSVAELSVVIEDIWGAKGAVIIEVTGDLDIHGTPYRNKYCYVVELDRDQKVTNLRIYLDSLYANELATHLQNSPNAIHWKDD